MHLQRGGHAHSKVDRGGVGDVGRDAVGVRLPDGRRRQRTDRLGQGRKGLHHGQRPEHEAAVEGEAREHAARDAQPVRAAHRREGDHARRARARSASSPASATICSASTSRPASRSGTGSSTATPTRRRRSNNALCPGGQTAVPTMAQVVARQVHGVRRVVGRPAAAGQRRRRPGRGAAREVHAGRRQAVRAQPAQRRHLHRERAGMRRPDQRVLLVRSGDAQSASAFIPAGGGLWGRRGAAIVARRHRLYRHRRRPVRSGQPAVSATASSAVKLDANKQLQLADYFARAERELAVAARPRRQHDAGALRLSRPEVPRRHEQGMPAVAARSRRARRRGSSHDARTPRRSSATTRRRSTRRGIWGALERVAGRRAARSGCSCRSGDR